MSRESMGEQLGRLLSADNDNRKPKSPKKPEPRYRGTLPALRWLYDNHPDLAEPVAQAVRDLVVTNWSPDAVDNLQEIRPSIGEIVNAATDKGTGEWLRTTVSKVPSGKEEIQIGTLKFVDGELVEYGRTRKGRLLRPRDRTAQRASDKPAPRNNHPYIFRTRATMPSPLHAQSYQRLFSGEPALVPMYDPQAGVEANRDELRKFGVDGSVAFEDLPFEATKCPPAIAKGAEFLGGVVQLSGNTSSGAVSMGEVPDAQKGDVLRVVEEIASGASLTEIGQRMGLVGARVDRMAKDYVLDAARILAAANDNDRKKCAA